VGCASEIELAASEIIFVVDESPDGGYEAQALLHLVRDLLRNEPLAYS
jgi:hypothetical protein